MKYIVSIKEQQPVNQTILCEIYVSDHEGDDYIFGQMYFLCDLNKKIYAWPIWLFSEQKVLRAVREQGYLI